jgi:hypothetical protein
MFKNWDLKHYLKITGSLERENYKIKNFYPFIYSVQILYNSAVAIKSQLLYSAIS